MGALAEVPVAAVSPERFRPLLGGDYEQVDEAAASARELLAGRVVWHVNSTAKGGGVAEMLHSLLAYARGAGVDVRWMTIAGNPDFFQVTKRIHNHLHESAGDGGPLGPAERRVYDAALREAADEIVQLVQPGDVVYIHDPQPAGLVPHVKAADVSVVWRCHIGVDDPGELARGAWEFLRPYVAEADAYIFSREQFVWEGLDRSKIWIVPPSTPSRPRTRTSTLRRSARSWPSPGSPQATDRARRCTAASTERSHASTVARSWTRRRRSRRTPS
jgi:trehalose synthase